MTGPSAAPGWRAAALARAALARGRAYASGFPLPIWFLTLASTVESTGRFMVVPYLSLFLHGKGVSLGILGLVLASAPVASVLFGAVGGHLSDRWGRKPVQILGVALSGSALIGFAFAGSDPLLLGLLNFLNGMTRTFYRPATSAAISDFCPSERRSEAFALNRIAINAAFGWGPLIGVALFATSPKAGFFIAGAVNLCVGLFLALVVPESHAPGRRSEAPAAGREAAGAGWSGWREVLTDRGFWLWNLGMMCVWGAYDLIQSFLPLHLVAKGIPLVSYGMLLTTNAAVCVFGQLPVSRAVRVSGIGPITFWSKAGYALGFVGFAFFRSPWALFASMLVLSLGEILGSGVQSRYIPERAPPRLLGRYMGLATMNELGRALVAPAAGFIMQAYGGELVFVCAGLLSLIGGGLAWKGAAAPAGRPRGDAGPAKARRSPRKIHSGS
ncbi:MAG TPA: MFS transporter [Rectinemataceae bacterium]|nr:MFS transporter [Rectinemataceae bacterium]